MTTNPSTPPTSAAEPAAPSIPTPAELGIGMRLSIHPHCDDFVRVILGALDDVAAQGLTDGLVIETDEVSTYVGAADAPAEQRLADYLTGLVAAASRRTGAGHVVAHVLLSRGCPGEVSCDLRVTGLPAPVPVTPEPTGIRAAAQWSLYPLVDGGTDGRTAEGTEDHMAHIEAAIAAARARGTVAGGGHYATRLAGDVADVVATVVDTWAEVGAVVPHVVTHLTLSVGSPSDGTRP